MSNKIYTKTGDKGVSSTFDGKRVSKADKIFAVLGGLDELNSWLGFVACLVDETELRQEIYHLQENLFEIGAMVAGSKSSKLKFNKNDVLNLETRIDFYFDQTSVDENRKFVLPGGSELAARIDLARSVCRRVEMVVVSYFCLEKNKKSDVILQFLNRLSDYLFALRCFVNESESVREREF